MELTSERIAFDPGVDVMEEMYARGWTDGLPVVPPTPEKVAAMLNAAALRPGDVLGAIPARNRVITAEKAAINAVMAGCRPEYMPVVAAILDAASDPAFNLHGPSATTAGTAILAVVNGPIAKQIGMNSGGNLFGPGNRANATIGRAIRLILMNVCGSRPEEFDRACLGHPGKYTYCIAENEDACDWTPLAQQRGVRPGESAVTVFAADGPNQIGNNVAQRAEDLLLTFADRMAALGTNNIEKGGDCECVVVIGLEHLATIRASGFSKRDVQGFLYEHARRPVADLKRGGLWPGPVEPGDEQRYVRIAAGPEQIMVVVGGGGAGRWSAFIPGWTGRQHSMAVTRTIGVRA